MVESKEVVIARLKAEEVWPFNSTDWGGKLLENRFYGFYDSGGVWIPEGHDTKEAAIAQYLSEDPDNKTSHLGFTPDDLGVEGITILTGREFIDKIYELVGYDKEEFKEWGYWSCTIA